MAQSPFMPAYQGAQPELVLGVEAEGLATARPKVRHVYAAAPDTLGIVIDAQALPRLPVRPYFARPGDEIRYARPQPWGSEGNEYFWDRQIIRDGAVFGTVHGPDKNYYTPPTRLEGDALDVEWAANPQSYAVTSTDDDAYTQPVTPAKVFRKTKPESTEYADTGKRESTARHEIFLKLPKPLKPGARYRIAFVNDSKIGDGVELNFEDTRLRTEAIHVNLNGYHPDESEKIGLMSMWLGDGAGVDFSALREFSVVDDATGERVLAGPIRQVVEATPGYHMPVPGDNATQDPIPVSVYALDFSALKQPGTYRVVVPGLGSSFPFRVSTDVWHDATYVSAKGIYNHRAGIALGPPHTTYKRPRNMHPEDGFNVFRTDPRKFFDPKTPPSIFRRIQTAIIDGSSHPEAWGGWMDAADFDRSIVPQEHDRAVHALLELYESNPEFFRTFDLNIPESGNGTPDVINEAVWGMDLWLRLQQEDGGIPSNIESIEHPSEPSWLLTQPTATTPPTPQGNHLYAAAAARLSLALRDYQPELAETYRRSAERAMDWAERNASVPDVFERDSRPPLAHANLAHAWMYRLTGDQKWHDRFKASLAELYPGGEIDFTSHPHSGPWGLAAYAVLPTDQVDPELQKRCQEAIVRAADRQLASINERAYNLVRPRNWGERLAQPWEVIIAHQITKDPKYLEGLLRLNQFSLGRNPHNASYTSGIGARQVVPFNLEAFDLGVPIPDGVTTWGPLPRSMIRAASMETTIPSYLGTHLYPATYEAWPWSEAYFNVRYYAMNEYTVSTNMGNILLLRGYLAAQFAKNLNP